MPYICQPRLPISPWMSQATRKLPGVQPIVSSDIFLVDEVFEQQMGYRDKLLKTRSDEVYFNDFDTKDPSKELLNYVITELKKNERYKFSGQEVMRPDGVKVHLINEDALRVAGSLVQEDILLLQKEGDQHILKAGVLCFPASWTLGEKKNKSLFEIHGPVRDYSKQLGLRIEKMFTNLKPKIPIWRANYLLYDDHELFQPRSEIEERGNSRKKLSTFMRVERQTLSKLALTETILFAIHTFVVPYSNLSSEQKRTLGEILE